MIFKSRIIYRSLSDLGSKEAKRLCNNAKTFQSSIVFKVGSKEADVKNVDNLSKLGLKKGLEVEIIANGKDEDSAVESLVEMLKKMK